ncbi:methylated-DNA--[protein]-cysteine S-methyltransferase [Streptomyces genisteinicus]|uniref:Methylated-DNA--protein-cysteine methyltransferase n=1 Tax=Streptomyces genisteinicus TaxID=2768068 RepID=A0A7H0HW03_9ACTN|nr:methylated-DNA--[protein]-cysteine S-methyltransferase [Streptomyces genisteinicus]QNP64719.1 methylated-DNA--[protein]-cysteine S-methyltransferase [Streptomyces genisteinicus]
MATVHEVVDSPLGGLLLIGEASATAPGGTALASLSLPGQKGAALVTDGGPRRPAAFREIARQLEAYFAGELSRFTIEYTDAGTEFQRRVWRALEDVPYGRTTTYKEVAARVGSASVGVRAVGTAVGRNPLLVVRPCHRVIGSDGALRGYAGGLEAKARLLGLEGALPS